MVKQRLKNSCVNLSIPTQFWVCVLHASNWQLKIGNIIIFPLKKLGQGVHVTKVLVDMHYKVIMVSSKYSNRTVRVILHPIEQLAIAMTNTHNLPASSIWLSSYLSIKLWGIKFSSGTIGMKWHGRDKSSPQHLNHFLVATADSA